MKTIRIKESVKIPGTNIILEKNDQIYFKESIDSFLDELRDELAKEDLYLTDDKHGFFFVTWEDFRTRDSVHLEIDTNTGNITCTRGGEVIYKYNLNKLGTRPGSAYTLMRDLEDAGAF